MKGKQTKWIGFGAIIAVCVASILTVILLILNRDTTEVAYTYEAVADNLPEYDTDLFQIDGKLDEEIYDELRWWEESYSEGEMQEPVKVRTTAYLGENGVYFIFDVDDDNVNVDMTRASYNNSSITVYAAEEGTHTLEDNVWEIDILPTDYINAKRYLGGYYYGTVRANGYENQPFVRTTTKGGAVNTPECKGYIMESYFPYGFLFKDGEKPENLNLNFALQRSYSLEADSRDVYYNFGQYVMSNWSWGDPGTWWTFNKEGLDSVDLTFEAGNGGKLEHRNDYIARYQTEKIKIVPDEGYRISSLLLEVNGETSNITDQIVWENEVNYIKLRNVTDNVKLKASFEKIPTTKMTLAGRVIGNGKADDLGIRFICGGIAYTTTVAESGTYNYEVPTGDGVLEVYSKAYGYVAKKIDVTTGSGTITNNIKLTANDYGNKRVMSLPSEQVMGNKERLFDGEKMTGSMSKTFAYDFTLKYNGQLLEKDGTPVADPTFGEYDNQYTSINFKGSFTDANGKAIEKSDMQLQIMSWNGDGMWMIKMWLDSQYVEARLGIDELKAFGSEEGVNFRLIFANSKLSLCVVRGNNVYKVTEIKTTATAERYLKYIDFYAEHCINHSIWYVQDQTLALGRTESDSRITANVANGDGVVTFKKSENAKVVRTATNWDAHAFDGAFGWTGTLQVPGVLKSGKIQYHEMKTGYWVDTSKNDKDWYQFTVYIIGDGDSYYVTKNNQKVKLELNETQIKLLGTTGLQVGAFVNGNAVSYFVDNGKGEMVVFADLYDFNENQAWYPWPNKYGGAYLIHEGTPKLGEVISTGAEFYTGLSKEMDVKGFVKDVIGNKYQSNQTLNPVTHTFDSEKNNYFVMNHKDVAENAFYGYNIQLDEWKNTSVYFNVKAWSEEYYASFVKLRVTEDTAYFIWQQGVSPYLCSEAIYFLNETQIAKLTNGGLDIFIEYKEHSTEMNLYVDDGKGNIVLASTYKDSLFSKSTGITYVKNLIGYSVEVENSETDVTVAATGCVVTESGNFASDVKALYNKNIVKGEQQAELIKIDSREIKTASERINLDYYEFNIGGNWFDHFNVKLDDAVNEKGEILKYSTIKLLGRLQGSSYFQQATNLRLTESGAYLEMPNYGEEDHDWSTYVYPLNAAQLKQLVSEDGMDIYISHVADNKITVYLAEGSNLIAVKEFTYGSQELWAKGYSASYEGNKDDSVQILTECVTYSGAFEEVLKNLYNKDYTSSTATGIYNYDYAVKNEDANEPDKNFRKEFTEEDSKALETYTHMWDNYFYKINIQNDGVDKDGNILADSEMRIQHNGLDAANGYKGSANIYLYLQEDGSSLKFSRGYAPWTSETIRLTEAQIKAIGSDNGLNLYIAHSSTDADAFTVYVEIDNKLLEMFTYEIPGANHGELCKVTYSNFTENMTVSGQAYNYADTDFVTAVKTIYGENFELRNRVDVNVEVEGAVVNGMKDIYHMGDTVSFTVQVDEGYKLETVTLNESPLTANSDGKYQFELTEAEVTSCDVKVTTSLDNPYYSFAKYTTTQANLDVATMNKMKEAGDYFLFQTNMKLAEFSKVEESTNAHVRVLFDLPGSGNTPVYRVMLYKENGKSVLKISIHNDSAFGTLTKELTSAQVAKIEGNAGLNVFLVQTGETTYTLYVEAGDTKTVEKVEGSTYTYAGANHVSQYRYDTKTGKTPTVVTTGYFYKQNKIDGAQLANTLLGSISEDKYEKFAQYTTGQANFDVATMNKMKESGDYFLFKTNFKLAGFSQLADNATSAHARVLFDLPGNNNTPVYRVMLHRENGKSVLKINIHNDSSFETLSKELTATQVAKIEGNAGLNVFLIQTGETSYTLYVEAGDTKTVEKVEGSTYTYAGANHVSQYRCGSQTNQSPTIVTTGYFYKQEVDGAQVANELLGN